MTARKPKDVRIAIGGRYLDEARMRAAKPHQPGYASYISFPASRHLARVMDDHVTIAAQATTVVQLYADGVLPNVGDRAVALEVDGKDLGEWILEAVESGEQTAVDDIIVLRFRSASRCR